MDFFLPSEVARLILGYLKENKFHKTHSCFLKECPHLQEYYTIMMEGRELQTTILGFSLIMILEEWGKLKQGNSVPGPPKPSIRRNTSPVSTRKTPAPSPLKQALSTSPYRSQQVRFSEKSAENSYRTADQKEQGYPLLKGLLDTISKKNSQSVHILPLTPEKQPSTQTSVNYSPVKDRIEQNEESTERDYNKRTGRNISEDTANTEHELPAVLGLVSSSQEKPDKTKSKESIGRHMQKTPNKSAVNSTPTLTAHLVTPVKLFQTESTISTTRSPHRKKPKTPRKRTSDIGSNSGSGEVHDVPEPVFKKILEDNKLHEKLAETCNTVLESINHSGSKERKVSPHRQERRHSGQGLENHDDHDVVTGSRSLEEILDMDTNFATDLVSENIDMSDPVYESLFKLFGKDKEVFVDELRKEKEKTEDMAKEVEELEKSIQQDIANAASEYNSPIHSVEMALDSPDIVHINHDNGQPNLLTNPSLTTCTQPIISSCPDNNPGGFLSSLRDSELGSPVHSTPSHRMSTAVSSPSSVVTQPFSPVEYSQILSPSTPYSTHPPTPSQTACTDTAQNNPGSNGFMSPTSTGPMSPHAVGNGDPHVNHQSTPVSNRQQKGYVEQTLANCSPLVKSDLTCASPIMVQKPPMFTPRSTYTPQSRKCIFTPQGTNRLLFSPPLQGHPAGQTSTGGEVQPQATTGQPNGEVLPQSNTNTSVHNESFGYQPTIDPAVSSSPSQVYSVTNPCSTIANSIDCISLPQEPEPSTSARKSRRTSRPVARKKGKTKSSNSGMENGSSTFTALKHLLNKPSSERTGVDGQPLSMPDLLCPSSPDVVHLSDTDTQNQNIVLLSPGGTSYKIPLLDCQDEMGIQSTGMGETETINVWESDLNNSTQFSILPENQVTQSMVTSIEQGKAPDMTVQVQKKTSEKSKRKQSKTKEPKKLGRKKKEKKSKKSGYFHSSSEKKGDVKESDEMYVASPLLWTDKTFVRNLDFGVDENKFRKILPKPTASTNTGTVLIVNNNPLVAEVVNNNPIIVETVNNDTLVADTINEAEFNQMISIDSQGPELTAVKIPMTVLDTSQTYTEPYVTYETNVVEDESAQGVLESGHSIVPSEDVTLQPIDNVSNIITTDGADASRIEGQKVLSAYENRHLEPSCSQSTTCDETEQKDQTDTGVDDNCMEKSPMLEAYKDWKGHMKPDKQQKPTKDSRKQYKTSTPLPIIDTVRKGDKHTKTSTEQLDTIKKANKIILKENAIKKLFKKSVHRLSHVKTETSLQGLRNIENKSAFKVSKSSHIKTQPTNREAKNKSQSPTKFDSSVEECVVVNDSSDETNISSPKKLNKKSSHSLSHLKTETSLQGLRNNETKSAFQKSESANKKASPTNRETKNKSPSPPEFDSSVEDSEMVHESSDDSHISSPKKSGPSLSHLKTKTSVQGFKNIETKTALRISKSSNKKASTNTETKSKIQSPPTSDSSSEESEMEHDSDSSDTNMRSPTYEHSKNEKKTCSVSPKKLRHCSTRVKISPNTSKSRGKTKPKGKGLLKVKIPCNKGKTLSNKSQKERNKLMSDFVIEEESSDEDIPLVKLQNKIHSKSPVKSPPKLSLKAPSKSTKKSPRSPMNSTMKLQSKSQKDKSSKSSHSLQTTNNQIKSSSKSLKSSESSSKTSKSPSKSSKSSSKSLTSPSKSPKSSHSSKAPSISSKSSNKASKSPRKSLESPRKSPAKTPVKSVSSTPQKAQDSDIFSPSKETLLEKVGLTPTKTLVSNELKSPGRANPLDVLAEWQGSPSGRKKRHSGPVTRNKLNHLNGGFKSPSPKGTSTIKRKTPGRNLFKNFTMSEKQEHTERAESSQKVVKPRNSNPKNTRGKKLFGVKANEEEEKIESKNDRKTNENELRENGESLPSDDKHKNDTDRDVEQVNKEAVETNEVTEDELQQALQSIQLLTGSAVSDYNLSEYSGTVHELREKDHNVRSDHDILSEDLSISSEELDNSKENVDIRINYIETNNQSDEHYSRNEDIRKENCNKSLTEDSVNHNVRKHQEVLGESKKVLSAYEIHRHLEPSCSQPSECENKTEDIFENDDIINENNDTEINYEEKGREQSDIIECTEENNNESSDENTVTYVPNKTNTNSIVCSDDSVKENIRDSRAQNVSDTGIEMSNYEENQDPLDERARRKERKRRHKEQRRIRKSLEAARLSQSAGKDTGIEIGQDYGGETSIDNESAERSGSHHRHHKHRHHHHHHHSKHKKKKSKKRHRDEEDSEHKEKHKSKKRRIEASRALEMVDIDEALTELYSSPIAAT